jgi:1,4-alpha-glucan branching enzyme
MGRVVVVLHAHLPWVKADEPWSATERWLHEAVWECYVPLLTLLERTAARVTLSVSPTLAAMLRDADLRARSRELFAVLAEKNRALAPSAELAGHYEGLLAAAEARGEGLVGAWARCPGVELITTAATHAFLPGLAPVGGAAAQLALGRALVPEASGAAMWLPECAIDDGVETVLGGLAIGATVVDAHAARLASPPIDGALFESAHGVVCAARDRDACLRVWSRHAGYPAHADYREFYRDAGFDAHEAALAPLSRGVMTGLKYHRVSGGEDKAIYRPDVARVRALEHAAEMAALLDERDVTVLAFDAELFGHWWHEGPAFLEAFLTRIAPRTTTLGALATERWPAAHPAPSSWGRGGYFRDWINEATAACWRPLHAAHRRVRDAARKGGGGRALDWAIGELLLLEASDWLYMIGGGDHADYARSRFEGHRARCERMLALAAGATPSSTEARLLERPHPLTGGLAEEIVRATLSA